MLTEGEEEEEKQLPNQAIRTPMVMIVIEGCLFRECNVAEVSKEKQTKKRPLSFGYLFPKTEEKKGGALSERHAMMLYNKEKQAEKYQKPTTNKSQKTIAPLYQFF